MYSMTESKVIQEADQAEQFQQNPHYFHRNIDQTQICHNIDFISQDVNTFIHKLQKSQQLQKYYPCRRNVQKPFQSILKISKQHQTTKPKSEIDLISSNTQSLIEDLSWMNTMKSVNHRKSVPYNECKAQSIIINSQTSFANDNQGFATKRSMNLQSSQRIPYQTNSKTVPISNSKSIDFNKSRFQRSSVKIIPKTIEILKKNHTLEKSQNIQSNNKNKIFFNTNKTNGNFKEVHNVFEDFDDKDTIVNEPSSNGRRKYSKAKVRTQMQQRSTMKEQITVKITKKQLLKKILNLQTQLQQIKSEQYKDYRQIYRQNQGLFHQDQIDRKKITKHLYQGFNQQSESKNRPTFRHSDKSVNANFQKKNTLSSVENNGKMAHLLTNPVKKLSASTITSNNNYKKVQKSDDSKISLAKWASQIWQ